jgi:hypothetical protein
VLLRSLSMSTDLFGSVLHQLNSLLGAAELRHSAVRRHANDRANYPPSVRAVGSTASRATAD